MEPLNTQLGLPIPLVLGIQPQPAHLLSLLFTTTYVGSLYLAQTVGLPAYLRSRKVKSTSNTPGIKVPPVSASDEPEVGSRDHPATIRIRMRAVGIATGLSLFGIYYVVKQTGNYGWKEAVSSPYHLIGAKAEKIDQTCFEPPRPTYRFDFHDTKYIQCTPVLARSINTIRPTGSNVPR
jgi:prenyl protein peptidase